LFFLGVFICLPFSQFLVVFLAFYEGLFMFSKDLFYVHYCIFSIVFAHFYYFLSTNWLNFYHIQL